MADDSHTNCTVIVDPLDRVLYSDAAVAIGLFDCPRHHPRFENSGPASGDLVVFPRETVEIMHSDLEPVVAGPLVITLYNHEQEYRRRAVSPYGDRSLWLRFPRTAVVEALIDSGQLHTGFERRPFSWNSSRCELSTYLAARSLLQTLTGPLKEDVLAIQEAAYGLLRSAIAGASEGQASVGRHREATLQRHRHLVASCQELLASRFTERLTMTVIAADLATTPFHLSRVFSELTGDTIHEYLMNLRLRSALDIMIDHPGWRLTDISADMGFCTPSHFAHRFRQSFGRTPANFRSHSPTSGRLRNPK